MFAGVNTDQCADGSLQDVFTKGWDCVLLSDEAGRLAWTTVRKALSSTVQRHRGFA
jgi:nicotinamidase-related amidase